MVKCQNCQTIIKSWTQWWQSVCPSTGYGCVVESEEHLALWKNHQEGDSSEQVPGEA